MEGEIDEYFRLKILFSSPWYLLHDSDGNDLSSSLNRAIKLSNAPALSLAADSTVVNTSVIPRQYYCKWTSASSQFFFWLIKLWFWEKSLYKSFLLANTLNRSFTAFTM